VTALARSRSNCTSKLKTHPLVRKDAPHQETLNRQTKNKNLVMGSDWSPTPRQTGRLTVGRKLTSTSTSSPFCMELRSLLTLHKSPTPVPIMSHFNPIHIFIFHSSFLSAYAVPKIRASPRPSLTFCNRENFLKARSC
jgi:hypothetical protein